MSLFNENFNLKYPYLLFSQDFLKFSFKIVKIIYERVEFTFLLQNNYLRCDLFRYQFNPLNVVVFFQENYFWFNLISESGFLAMIRRTNFDGRDREVKQSIF